MMRVIHTARHFRSCAPLVLGALLCLCFSLSAHPDAPSKDSLMGAFPGSHIPDAESINSWPWGFTKSLPVGATNALFFTCGKVRAKQAPLHPAHLPPERFTGLSLGVTDSPMNKLVDVHSLLSFSPIQDRAPPRFA